MNSNIFFVHVQGAAVDLAYTYTGERQTAAYRKLAEICQQVGFPQDSENFFSLGYDDVSFEVPTQADAVQACDALNKSCRARKARWTMAMAAPSLQPRRPTN